MSVVIVDVGEILIGVALFVLVACFIDELGDASDRESDQGNHSFGYCRQCAESRYLSYTGYVIGGKVLYEYCMSIVQVLYVLCVCECSVDGVRQLVLYIVEYRKPQFK